jgi:hypothetical protein
MRALPFIYPSRARARDVLYKSHVISRILIVKLWLLLAPRNSQDLVGRKEKEMDIEDDQNEWSRLKAEVRNRFLAMPRVQKAAAASGLCPVDFVDDYDYEAYLPYIEDALGVLGDDFETLCQWSLHTDACNFTR